MHEASIALNILSIAEEHCKKAGLSRIDSVSVRVGGASGVLPDALLFAFNVVKTGTCADKAELLVEEVPLGGTCRSCGRDFTTGETFVLECPMCGGADFLVKTGKELDITEIEAN